MMALLRKDNPMSMFTRTATPTVESTLDPGFDVMRLRRLRDHPWLRPLMVRRQDLSERLRLLEADRQRLEADVQRAEATEVEQIAVMGGEWNPAAFRQLKAALEETATEERMITGAQEVLDQKIEDVTSEVRHDVEERLNRLRKPLVEQIVAALESVVEANRQIHAIEALSQGLLQHAKYHLYDAGLPQRLVLMQRTQRLLALGELGDGDAA
jgi:flagellar biosynthesis GTPase FlhF